MRRAVYVANTMPGPDLVARIYDHALAGDPTALLAEVASAAGLDALGFAFHDDVIADRPLVAHGVEAAARMAYSRHHREDRVWSAAMCAAPLGTVQEALPRPSSSARACTRNGCVRSDGPTSSRRGCGPSPDGAAD
jgi:hypothetical protein